MREVDKIFNSMLGGGKSSPYAPLRGLTIAGGCVPTDIYPTDAQDIEFEFAFPQGITGNDTARVLGAQIAWRNKMTKWVSSDSTHMVYFSGVTYPLVFSFATTADTYYKVKSVLSGANRTFTVTDENDVVIVNVTVANQPVEQNTAFYALFGVGVPGDSAPTTDPVTLTKFIVREGGVTTHDIVPRVRLADNVAGMLDIVTGTFYVPTGGTITPNP